MRYNKEFPVLSMIAVILQVIGALLIFVPILITGYYFIEAHQSGYLTGIPRNTLIIASIITLVVGLAVEAFAELIGVLFAIELNTRRG